MSHSVIELPGVESNRKIENQYQDALVTFFSSGEFLLNKEFSNNPIKLNNALVDYYSNNKLKNLTHRIFTKVNDYHIEHFDAQINSKKAANYIATKPYQEYTEQLQYLNYTVTKNLRDNFIYDVVLASLMQGLFNTPDNIERQMIDNSVNKINERIEIISSDQVIKITQGLTIAKCKALGLPEYKWQTMEDDRVRPTHAANNQKIFDWDNPPPETGHPGTQIRCRCKAKIIVDKSMAYLLDLD